MLGLLIAVAYFLYLLFIGGEPDTTSFLSAASFLNTWYWVTSCIVGAVIVVILLLAVLGFTAAGAKGGGAKGALLGLVGAGSVSAVTIASFVIRAGMLIGGSYLLMTAGTAGSAWSDFSTPNLVIGGVLLFIAMLLRGRSSKSDD